MLFRVNFLYNKYIEKKTSYHLCNTAIFPPIFQIAQRALEALSELIGRLGQDFNAYTPTVFQNVVDR